MTSSQEGGHIYTLTFLRHAFKNVFHFVCVFFFLFQIFDERTGRKSSTPMTFWSIFGEKVSKNREKRALMDAIKQINQVEA